MIAQIAIALLGVTAIYLSQSADSEQRKFACLFGLAGQPFWFWSAISAEQWGIVFLCFFYTVAWMKGVKTHWSNPERPDDFKLDVINEAFDEAARRG